MIDCIAVLIETPCTVTIQICQQVVTGMLEFLAIEPQPHQPDPKGKQLIVAVGLRMTVLRWAIAWAEMARHRFT